MADKWPSILNDILGSKDNTKAGKAVKRAVAVAREKHVFSSESKSNLKSSLRSLLASGAISGFVLHNERVERVQVASQEKKSKKRDRSGPGDSTPSGKDGSSEKKKKKKRKREDVEPAVPAVDIPEQLPILPEVDDDTRWRADLKRTNVKSGVLTAAEKETLRSTVEAYAQSKGFSTDDYSWLIVPGKGQRKKHKNTEGVWKIVAAALPNRTIKSVASAGLRMFHPNARLGAWTAEEDAQLRSLVEERGRQWSEIGAALGRARWSCRDRWREIKLGDSRGKGPWTEEETEKLKAAVEEYQAMKAGGEQGDKGGDGDALDRRIVLDDINWEAISAKVGTRSHIQCLEKWYDQLRPSMVATGDWGAGDDRRMLRALWSLWGCAEYEVPWGEVVKGRTAAQARRRWRLMCKAVPDVRDMEFPDVVDWLVDKYLPHLKDKGTVGEEEAAAAAS